MYYIYQSCPQVHPSLLCNRANCMRDRVGGQRSCLGALTVRPGSFSPSLHYFVRFVLQTVTQSRVLYTTICMHMRCP